MLDLSTVQGFVFAVRGLLLDKVQPYRYPDDAILAAMNFTFLDGRRLRADLFVHRYHNDVPQVAQISGDTIPIEPQFRLAFLYGTAGHVLMRDEEDIQDARANAFRTMFEGMLLGVRQPPLQGGTPGPQQANRG